MPIDPTIAEKEELSKSRNCWQTSEGFVFPGKKTSLQSNRHAMEPDFARLDELKKVNHAFTFHLFGVSMLLDSKCVSFVEENHFDFHET